MANRRLSASFRGDWQPCRRPNSGIWARMKWTLSLTTLVRAMPSPAGDSQPEWSWACTRRTRRRSSTGALSPVRWREKMAGSTANGSNCGAVKFSAETTLGSPCMPSAHSITFVYMRDALDCWHQSTLRWCSLTARRAIHVYETFTKTSR